MAIIKQYAKLEDYEESIARAKLLCVMWDFNYIQNKEGGIDGAIIKLTCLEVGAGVSLFHVYTEQHLAKITTKEELTAFAEALKVRTTGIIQDIHKVYPAAILQEGAYLWQQ